jgi:telomere length regulation protein
VKQKPTPKVVMLDPDQEADPLQGYSPESPSSSRSPSPTPSYLEEVAADPTLALDSAQNKKAARPVYVQQLIMLLKEREKPDYIEMGLKWGEGLVRAKRSFGTELCKQISSCIVRYADHSAENAVNLAMVTVALNNPYNIDNFEESRQGLLNALVACSPKQVAP